MLKSDHILSRDLDLASPLKAHLVSCNPRVLSLADKYLDKIKAESQFSRFPESKIRNQLLVLICNFIWVNRKNNRWIYQGRGKAKFCSTRYFSGLTHDIFVKRILDTLVALDLIEQRIGYQSSTKAKVTRIRAKGILKKDVSNINASVIRYTDDYEIILVQKTIKTWFDVRSGKTIKIKAKLDYIDNAMTKLRRSNLSLINKKLDDTFLGLWIKDEELKKLHIKMRKDEKYEFNFNEKTLARVYNDTEFNLGGRFYHGWWQYLPGFIDPISLLIIK